MMSKARFLKNCLAVPIEKCIFAASKHIEKCIFGAQIFIEKCKFAEDKRGLVPVSSEFTM